MTFAEVRRQVLELLQQQGRVSYRALKRQFELDGEYLEDLKEELALTPNGVAGFSNFRSLLGRAQVAFAI